MVDLGEVGGGLVVTQNLNPKKVRLGQDKKIHFHKDNLVKRSKAGEATPTMRNGVTYLLPTNQADPLSLSRKGLYKFSYQAVELIT